MRLSVIVSVYNDNHDNFLQQCMDSILDQDLSEDDYEVIAVDDLSTDDSLEVLREYEKKDKRVKVIAREENGGPGAGKNTGIRAAQGTYVAYIDHDDFIAKDAYKRLLELAEKEDADLCGGGWQVMNNVTKVIKPMENKVFNKTGEITDEMREMIYVRGERFWNKIIRKSIITDSDIYLSEGTYIDDTPTTPVWMCLCEKYAHLDEIVYTTRVHTDSSSRSGLTYEKAHQHMITQHRMVENAKKAGIYDKFKTAIQFRYFYRGYIQSSYLCRKTMKPMEVMKYYVALRHDLLVHVPGFRANKYIRQRCTKKQLINARAFMDTPMLYDLMMKLLDD